MSILKTLHQIWVNVNFKYKHKHMANHGGKGARRRYQERRRLLKQSKPTTYSRSEDGSRYEYDNQIANKFAGWSTKQRDAGKVPTFRDFYKELPEEDKSTITVTEVFKNA